jgi:outer membrane protein assembly factor BamB
MKKSRTSAPKPIWYALFIVILTPVLQANDWPKWLGPNENNQVAAADNFDPNLENWKIAWQKNVGLGYSSTTTFQGKVYTMGHDGKSKETISALDHGTGDELWSYIYEGDLIPSIHVGGPNASVLISDGCAYAVSKDGQIICLNADTGEKVWNAYLTELLGIEVPKWGFGSSPVAFKDEIIVSAGKVVAFDKMTGNVRWISPTDRKPGYGTPIVFDRNRENFIAATDAGGLSILKASNGEEVARKDMRVKFDVFLTSPAIFEGGNKILLFNNSYSELYSFDGKKSQSIGVTGNSKTLSMALSGLETISTA